MVFAIDVTPPTFVYHNLLTYMPIIPITLYHDFFPFYAMP